MQSYKILVVGYGNIGQHLCKELKSPVTEIKVYDKFKSQASDLSIRIANDIEEYANEKFDYAFICVPTEMLQDGSCDVSQVEDAVLAVHKNVNARVIVLKSTVPVGTSENLIISKDVTNLIFSPEYYGTTIHAPEKLDFVVLAGDTVLCDDVAQLYYSIKPKSLRIKHTELETAELAKYMENCFLAMKVAFCSEFAIIAEHMGISYPDLREIFVLDERMGDSHTLIRKDQPYFDSHCLNKDVPGLIKQTHDAKLMSAVYEINKDRKKIYKKE